MSFPSRVRAAWVVAIALLLTSGITQRISAQDDVFHIVKGVVKAIDKGTKTMVVKAADGTDTRSSGRTKQQSLAAKMWATPL